ncbi:hypothetical protein [Caballeronia grimmiae]|uniref:hypothetical protein n=1 Tax=Caballeronia grimmiae TaxID=1071679 RepID=UPI0038BC77EC
MAGFNRHDFPISSDAAIASTGLSSLAFARNQAAAPRRGGTLNVPINPEPPVLVPIFQTAGSALVASSKVIEGLLHTTSISSQCHDGQPFTSAGVAVSVGLPKSIHPRRFESWTRGANIVHHRNPDHWDASKPRSETRPRDRVSLHLA